MERDRTWQNGDARLALLIASVALLPLLTAPQTARADSDEVRNVRFSPNSRVCAYRIFRSLKEFAIMAGPATIGKDAILRWSVGPEFSEWKSRRAYADTVPLLPKRGKYVFMEYSFSPDSARIAMVGNHGVECIDLASGEARFLAEGNGIGEPVWRTPTEILYATLSDEVRGEARAMKFWRLRVDKPDAKPIRVGSVDVSVFFEGHAPHAFSPSGRFVIVTPGKARPWVLIDMDSGKKTEFGGKMEGSSQIAWRRDDGGAICISEPFRGNRPEGFLIDTETRRVRSLTDDLRHLTKAAKEKGIRYGWWFALDPLWSWDDRDLVFQESGWLIRPAPWSAIDVRKRLSGLRPGLGKEFQGMWQLSVPGWYLLCTKKGKPDDSACTFFAVDVNFSKIRPLQEVETLAIRYRLDGASTSVSPDGMRVGVLERTNDNRIRVVELKEPLVPIATKNEGRH